MKKFKNLLLSLGLIPLLMSPALAADEEVAPQVAEVKIEKVETVKTSDENKNPQNTLDKKIEEAHEVKSKEGPKKKQGPSYSSWAVKDLNDAQFMGILPAKTFYEGRDFRKAVTLEDAREIYKLAKEKIESRGLKTGGDFTFKDLTRLETLESISKLLNDDKFAVKNLKESKIFLGQEDEEYLNSKIPLEEVLALYNRATKKTLQDNDKVAKGFFYEIENKNNKVYMLGSIHIGKTSMYPIDQNIINSLKNSDKIFMEIDLTNQEKLAEMQEKMYYKDGGSLKDDLGEELFARVANIFKDFGMTEDQVNKLKPWAIYNSLSIDPKGEVANATYGIESYFLALSLLNNLELDELESVDFQSDLLSNFDKEAYISMIKNLTDEIEKNGYKNINASLSEMLSAWENGNKGKMVSLLSTEGDEATEKFNEALLSERDKNMAKKIDAMLKEDGENTYFILVGAAHLVPENSVTGILKDMGYEVLEK